MNKAVYCIWNPYCNKVSLPNPSVVMGNKCYNLCAQSWFILMPIANCNMWHQKSWTLVQFLKKKIKIQVMATTTSEWEFMQLKEKMFCYSVLEENSSPYICLNSLLQARIWLSQISLSLKVNFLYKINLNCKTQRTPKTFAKLILSWIFEWHYCVTDTFLF